MQIVQIMRKIPIPTSITGGKWEKIFQMLTAEILHGMQGIKNCL